MRTDHQFSQTKRADIPRSSFDLSHGLKTTIDFGWLYPILSLEVLPGDTINCRASLFGRLATPIKPVLDNMYLETFFFFVPYRQTWVNWVRFMGEQDDPASSIDFVIPSITDTNPIAEGSLYDYMGIPINLVPNSTLISALPFRAYSQIYNFWFRDENLIDSVPVDTGDGPDDFSVHKLQRRRKRRDYLTSGLPWPQKGDAVTIPLGDSAPIFTDAAVGETIGIHSSDTDTIFRQMDTSGAALTAQTVNPADQGMFANLQDATSITINTLRESFQIQKLLERDARGGTRYPEILQSHFQVTDPALLVHQRPLFLGGGSTAINITAVPQTGFSATDVQVATTPQGNLAGYGTVSATNHGFTASFTEHGHIIGLVNARADLTYQQGLERYWSRLTRYDFYFPVLSHLGEQSVKLKEIFVSNAPATDDSTFSYMPRYDEYRFKQSQITGLFRSDATNTLDIWHLAQDFSTFPQLNQQFIEDDPPVDRVIAVPSEPHLLLDVYFKIRAARPLPLYATPGLIDHF